MPGNARVDIMIYEDNGSVRVVVDSVTILTISRKYFTTEIVAKIMGEEIQKRASFLFENLVGGKGE